MSDLISCSRCGRIHPRGQRCNIGRKYPKTEEKRLRSTNAWTQKAKQIKNDALGLCEVCRAEGVYTYDGLEVHHIRKLAEYPDGLLEDENLICLCVYHHKKADRGELQADYLRGLAKERIKRED